MLYPEFQAEYDDHVEYVSYQTSNRLLIIANKTRFDYALASLNKNFRISWLPTDNPGIRIEMLLHEQGVETLPALDSPEIKGYLGYFTLLGVTTSVYDLVLDLQQQPAIKSAILPFGYYHVKDNLDGLVETISELPDMIGQFDKPKYFQLDTQKCAHNRRGIEGCRQCIEVCATDAISSESGVIQINPYLCQGCGDCASICPSGAISYQYPERLQTLMTIKQKLAAQSAILLLHSGKLPDNINCSQIISSLTVETLSSTGMDIWLSAIAYGAQQVWLLDTGDLTAVTLQVLTELITQANEILAGLGYAANLIQLAGPQQFVVNSEQLQIAKAIYQPDADKRTAIRMAIEHLLEQADTTAQSCHLSTPASFGAIEVNQAGCTLCMSCVSVCPTQALLSASELPQLKFIEAQCVQCGICSHACPEQVISLSPRYLYDSVAARKPRLLYEEQPFHCIVCDKAFAAQSMINTIMEKLQHHPMFHGEKKRQLMMCEDCKVISEFDNK